MPLSMIACADAPVADMATAIAASEAVPLSRMDIFMCVCPRRVARDAGRYG
ncbi:hypothetical protein GCM10011505_50850 [Tistrella bauzanensis]|uniref:Uncharacterized protein n=1 Tax=Tistrella bauzanensis TaxID=657419 RepID=A0ABQ1JEJ5_9PROT|nr:hypothetical protein GCM10011505_50850 [Tistrella bauzanensis]